MNKKGEPRHGGMQKGWRKPEGTRTQHQIRAYDDEWEIIRAFARIIKHGDKNSAIEYVESHKV